MNEKAAIDKGSDQLFQYLDTYVQGALIGVRKSKATGQVFYELESIARVFGCYSFHDLMLKDETINQVFRVQYPKALETGWMEESEMKSLQLLPAVF
ncbi:hypothetical protein ES705_15662 [subsurface metagenome]